MTKVERRATPPSTSTLLLESRLTTVVLIAIVGAFSVNVVAPALPAMSDAFGVSSARAGLVMTAFTVPIIVFVPLTGILADLYGRRPIIVPSLLVFGLAGVAIGVASSFATVLLLRAVQGAAYAGIMPLTVTILGDRYTGAVGSTVQGIREGAIGASSVVVPAIAGALVAIAWNAPFLLFLLAIPAAVRAYYVLPETGGTADGESGLVATTRSYLRSVRTQLDDSESRTLLVGGFARDFVRLTVITFVPLFAVDTLGASAFEAGVAVGMRGLSRTCVAPLAGTVVSRLSQRTTLVIAIVTIASGAVAIAFAPSVTVLWVLVVLYGVGDSLLAPVLKTAVAELTGEEYRAGVINGLQVAKSTAQSIAPAVSGAVLAWFGFRAVFVLAGVVAGCYAVAVFLHVRS